MKPPESSPFRSFKVLDLTIKPSISDEEASKGSDQSLWSFKTPQNPPFRPDLFSSSSQPISASQTETPVDKFPKMYDELYIFFISLDRSIRLLQLKRSAPSFSNISPEIEHLTKRRFSYVHLAQLKYLLPEVIEVEKILVQDERTCLMKHDLQITLNVNATESDGKLKSDGVGLSLREVFKSRLLNFIEKNPEADEVPEETLPEPFNRSHQVKNLSTMMNPILTSIGTSSGLLPGQQICASSRFSPSFKRHFSKQVSSLDVVQVNQEQSRESLQTSELPPSSIPTTPVKFFYSEFSSMDSASTQGAPIKLFSTPVRLMSTNPPQKPLKRYIMSPDDDSFRPPTKLAFRSRRSIKFDTPVKDSIIEDERLSVDDYIFDIHSGNLLESIREKEIKALEEKDPAISQAKWRPPTKLAFRSRRSIKFDTPVKNSILKDERLSADDDIFDIHSENLLESELVPEWIHEKKTAIGDLFCVNKFTCPKSTHRIS